MSYVVKKMATNIVPPQNIMYNFDNYYLFFYGRMMLTKKRLLLRIIASALCLSFTASELYAGSEIFSPPSAPAPLWQNPELFEAPQEFAGLSELHRGDENKFIIHIQDAHSNLSGQKNLASTLDALMEKYGVRENAIFMPGLRDPQYSEWIAFSGVSVDSKGKQHYLDSWLAYQNACNHAIDYMMKFGYTDIQAYIILGTAPVEGRLSGVVDIPNACSTIYIPR